MCSGLRPSSTAIARSLCLAVGSRLQVFAALVRAANAFRAEFDLLGYPETMTGDTGLRRHDLRGWFDHDQTP
ncbi:hypothetical protein [uncultured Roseibium sp.]|uniref:hypothetical protein n=1 Tax=uncultured Roseibium sp. TaxID=1936171 RepID=UPI00262AC045|nr:hypothetical protein [uncultured Roseibium sp.]